VIGVADRQDSIAEHLSELSRLRDAGALSEDEFGQAKARLIGSYRPRDPGSKSRRLGLLIVFGGLALSVLATVVVLGLSGGGEESAHDKLVAWMRAIQPTYDNAGSASQELSTTYPVLGSGWCVKARAFDVVVAKQAELPPPPIEELRGPWASFVNAQVEVSSAYVSACSGSNTSLEPSITRWNTALQGWEDALRTSTQRYGI
jgi:hypothetical protein